MSAPRTDARERLQQRMAIALAALAAISARLRGDEPRIRPVAAAQLPVPAALDDPSVFEDEDAVGSPHRREPMRDDDRGATRVNGSSAAWIAVSAAASTFAVASSSTRIGASLRTARAIASRWRCPPERRTPRSPTTVA